MNSKQTNQNIFMHEKKLLLMEILSSLKLSNENSKVAKITKIR